MEQVKKDIYKKLWETETNYDVKIPIAIESGSRGWGFASPDSDYDCRFIYVHKKDWYLTVLDKPDFIEYAADPIFDVNGWDLKKVLTHIMKSNAVMLEWLTSNEIYIKDDEIAEILLNLAKEYFNPMAVMYHYLSICKNKMKEILLEPEAKLKKYFYILRPIACIEFIHRYSSIPYMEYEKNLEKIYTPPDVLVEIKKLMALKITVDETYIIPQNTLLIAYFQSEIEKFEGILKEMKFTKNRNYENVDIAFKTIIDKVWQNAEN